MITPETHVENLIKTKKNWVEFLDTGGVMRLLAMHKDICQEEIKFLDPSGYIDTKKAFPRKFLNKYILYMHLFAHKKVLRCAHAEKILAKME